LNAEEKKKLPLCIWMKQTILQNSNNTMPMKQNPTFSEIVFAPENKLKEKTALRN
jgi:hypothetical protein